LASLRPPGKTLEFSLGTAAQKYENLYAQLEEVRSAA